MAVPGEAAKPVGGRLNRAIANAVVRRHKQFLGRGPTSARAFYSDRIIVVVLQDALTDAERSLAASGDAGAVLQMRRHYQQAMRHDLMDAIEELTGSKVEALLSGSHIDPDLTAELFVLDRPVSSVAMDSDAPGPLDVQPALESRDVSD